MALYNRGTLQFFRNYFAKHTLLLYGLVFAAVFCASKLAQYIFFEFNTSPALIFPSVGIALAAVVLGGYRMWIPIALANFFAFVTTVPTPPVFLSLVSIAAYTLQPLLGAYLLKKVRFDPSLRNTRDAVVFIGAALLLPAIGPAFTTFAAHVEGLLISTPWQSWSRAWAGGVLSILVVSPLVFTWLSVSKTQILRKKVSEKLLAIVSLFVPIYLLFWMGEPPINTFLLLYLFFGVLFWIGLRMGPRMMTLSLFLIASLSIAGTLIVPLQDDSINERLLSIELFVVLIAPIFLILACVVEERRVIALALMQNIEKLETALREISMADSAKSEFIAILAHELRNPLAPIVSSLEWLKLQEQTQESLDTIEIAETHTHTMKRLLDDLLDVARVAQKKFRLQKERAELHKLMSVPLHSAENLMHVRHHDLVVTLPKEQVLLYVDPVRFQQIIVNLLSNAAKYTQKGGHIELRSSVVNNELLIEVEDNGLGIEPQNLKKIFNPFRQVSEVSESASGLGIGLYLTKKFVEMHGGRIHASSEGKGMGTKMTIYFPIIEAPKQEDVPSAASENAQVQNGADLKILLVDDNQVLAKGLQKLLQYKGYTVELAHSGLEALVALDTFKPRVMFLDIGLPDMDGYSVAKEIRERKIPVTIIALTGYGQEKDRGQARDAGFDYHLVKPVGIADLELILKEATA